MNDKIKAELPALIKGAADEILTKQREAAKARIKPVLEFKEAMDKSITDCEADLAKAKKVRDEFAAKLAAAEGGSFEALEEAEKIIGDAPRVAYQRPALNYSTVGYAATDYSCAIPVTNAATFLIR